MEKKFKVENCLINGEIYLNCEAIGSRTYVIPKKMKDKKEIPFLLLSEEEISYIASTSRFFDLGYVRVVDDGTLPDRMKELLHIETVTVDDIDTVLALPITKLKKKIAEIDREDFIRELIVSAKEKNLPVNTITAIEKRLEELLPKIIIDEPEKK